MCFQFVQKEADVVYTEKAGKFSEVVIDHTTGKPAGASGKPATTAPDDLFNALHAFHQFAGSVAPV
jgi:hypothetical protein